MSHTSADLAIQHVNQDVNQRLLLMLIHKLVHILVCMLNHMLNLTLADIAFAHAFTIVSDIALLTFSASTY